eukprot:g24395.t1
MRLLKSFATCLLGAASWKTLWFEQQIDHSSDIGTFSQRYLLDDDQARADGPVLFFCGNEGDIEVFANFSGFLREAATALGAQLVFAEHRFYGQSLPFGPEDFGRLQVQYLNVEQALEDYAQLIRFLVPESLRAQRPVVAFGGSYGGMLSSWMRAKYPELIFAAVASSAPVHFDRVGGSFFRMVTDAAEAVSPGCAQRVRPVGSYYNATGGVICHNITEEYRDCADQTGCGNLHSAWGRSWDVEACRQIVYYTSTNNVTDMFPAKEWGPRQLSQYCKQTWNITPETFWFGPWLSKIQQSSHIIFTYGLSDPWRGGGVLNSSRRSDLVSLKIREAGHIYDLAASHPDDLPDVRKVRQRIIALLREWLASEFDVIAVEAVCRFLAEQLLAASRQLSLRPQLEMEAEAATLSRQSLLNATQQRAMEHAQAFKEASDAQDQLFQEPQFGEEQCSTIAANAAAALPDSQARADEQRQQQADFKSRLQLLGEAIHQVSSWISGSSIPPVGAGAQAEDGKFQPALEANKVKIAGCQKDEAKFLDVNSPLRVPTPMKGRLST